MAQNTSFCIDCNTTAMWAFKIKKSHLGLWRPGVTMILYLLPPTTTPNPPPRHSTSLPDGPDNMDLTVKSQNSTSFPAGSNLTLLCSAQSSPMAQLQWAVRGMLVDAAGPQLDLSAVSQEQSGDYTCLAFNSYTNMRSSVTKHILVTGKQHVFISIPQLSSLVNPHPLIPQSSPNHSLHCISTEWSGCEQQATAPQLLILLLLLGFLQLSGLL